MNASKFLPITSTLAVISKEFFIWLVFVFRVCFFLVVEENQEETTRNKWWSKLQKRSKRCMNKFIIFDGHHSWCGDDVIPNAYAIAVREKKVATTLCHSNTSEHYIRFLLNDISGRCCCCLILTNSFTIHLINSGFNFNCPKYRNT